MSNNELVTIESKNLSDIIYIPETVPSDFYENSALYEARIDAAIEVAKSLTHTIDDDGRKKAKADVALIRKMAKRNKAFSTTIFKNLTEKVGSWKTLIFSKSNILEDEADNIMARFDEHEKKILRVVSNALIDGLEAARNKISVGHDFRYSYDSAIAPMVKLTGTLTPAGQLTQKAREFVEAIAQKEKNWEITIKNREMLIENRCLKAGIIPPYSKNFIGESVYLGSDEAIFLSRLDALIVEDEKRRIEIENKAKDKAEALNVAEKFAIAQEQLKSAFEQCKPSGFEDAQHQLEETFKKIYPVIDPVPVDDEKKITGTRAVKITLEFECTGVPPDTTNKAVENVLVSKLSDGLKKRLKTVSSANV